MEQALLDKGKGPAAPIGCHERAAALNEMDAPHLGRGRKLSYPPESMEKPMKKIPERQNETTMAGIEQFSL